jgi:hypothetical protein
MKTTKQRLLNIVIAGSIAINLVTLAALGYIATIDHSNAQLDMTMRAPVFIYVPKIAENQTAATAAGLSSVK